MGCVGKLAHIRKMRDGGFTGNSFEGLEDYTKKTTEPDLHIEPETPSKTYKYGFLEGPKPEGEANIVGGIGGGYGRLDASLTGITPADKESREYFPGLIEGKLKFDVNPRLNLGISGEYMQGNLANPKLSARYKFENGGEIIPLPLDRASRSLDKYKNTDYLMTLSSPPTRNTYADSLALYNLNPKMEEALSATLRDSVGIDLQDISPAMDTKDFGHFYGHETIKPTGFLYGTSPGFHQPFVVAPQYPKPKGSAPKPKPKTRMAVPTAGYDPKPRLAQVHKGYEPRQEYLMPSGKRFKSKQELLEARPEFKDPRIFEHVFPTKTRMTTDFENGGEIKKSGVVSYDPTTQYAGSIGYTDVPLVRAADLPMFTVEAEDTRIADAVRGATTEIAKDYLTPIAKTVGAFTPIGPAIGLTDAYYAFQQGDVGSALLGAGLEMLPAVLKNTPRMLKSVITRKQYPKKRLELNKKLGKEVFEEQKKQHELFVKLANKEDQLYNLREKYTNPNSPDAIKNFQIAKLEGDLKDVYKTQPLYASFLEQNPEHLKKIFNKEIDLYDPELVDEFLTKATKSKRGLSAPSEETAKEWLTSIGDVKAPNRRLANLGHVLYSSNSDDLMRAFSTVDPTNPNYRSYGALLDLNLGLDKIKDPGLKVAALEKQIKRSTDTFNFGTAEKPDIKTIGSTLKYDHTGKAKQKLLDAGIRVVDNSYNSVTVAERGVIDESIVKLEKFFDLGINPQKPIGQGGMWGRGSEINERLFSHISDIKDRVDVKFPTEKLKNLTAKLDNIQKKINKAHVTISKKDAALKLKENIYSSKINMLQKEAYDLLNEFDNDLYNLIEKSAIATAATGSAAVLSATKEHVKNLQENKKYMTPGALLNRVNRSMDPFERAAKNPKYNPLMQTKGDLLRNQREQELRKQIEEESLFFKNK